MKKLPKLLSLGYVLLFLTSCVTYSEERRALATIEILSDAELAQEVTIALSPEQQQRLVEDLRDFPAEMKTLLGQSEQADLSLSAGQWHEIIIAIRKDQVRNPERYDERGPLAEILLKLAVALEEAGLPHLRHPTAVQWQKDHLAIAESISSRPSRARVRVVDQDGEPLNGVTLEIDKSILRPIAWEPTSRMRTVVVDGEITISLTGAFVEDINLSARKEGYYPARTPVRQPQRDNVDLLIEQAWADVVLGRETIIDPEEPKLLNVVLELRKKGELVQLYSPFGNLKIRADGRAIIANLSLPERVRTGSLREPQGFLYEVDDLGIYLEEEIKAKDVILLVDFEEGRIADLVSFTSGIREIQYPREIRLRMGDKEGGFILHRAPPDARPMAKAYHLMMEAPEDGYEQEITVSIEDLQRIEDEGYLMFYFKTNGHYGKGGIAPLHRMNIASENLEWVSHTIGFRINPTPGDRNLEDGRFSH